MPTIVPWYRHRGRILPRVKRVYSEKGVFTLVPSKYRIRASSLGTKCERCLKLQADLFESFNPFYSQTVAKVKIR